MHDVTVDRDRLIEKLKENREKHVNTFEETLEAYRNKAVELLEEHIERIRNGDVEQVNVQLPQPKNYEEEYDRAIEMLEWSEDDSVELDHLQFNQYVRDNWAWKQGFTAMSAMYTEDA